eukprot:1626802-Amphidinium_carterae.1
MALGCTEMVRGNGERSKEIASQEFILGRSAPIPIAEHALESVARCEILDAIPEWLKSQINTAGMHSTKDVMWFILK